MSKSDNHSSAGSAGLDIPPERRRTDEQRKDIQRAWDIVGMVTDGHLLNSTEGHLAVLRGIQMGRRLTGDVAQSAAVSPGVIERMVTGAWDDARAQAIEECAKICEGGEWTRYATNHSPTKSCAIAIRALASQPSPAATVETEYRWPGDNKTQSERQRCSAATGDADDWEIFDYARQALLKKGADAKTAEMGGLQAVIIAARDVMPTEPQTPIDGMKLVAALFSESVHETWTKEEIANIIEDAIRLGSPLSRPQQGGGE